MGLCALLNKCHCFCICYLHIRDDSGPYKAPCEGTLPLNEELSELPRYLLGTMVTAAPFITLIGGPANLTFLSTSIPSGLRTKGERHIQFIHTEYKSWLCSICVNSHRELAEVHGLYMYSRCRLHSASWYLRGGQL